MSETIGTNGADSIGSGNGADTNSGMDGSDTISSGNGDDLNYGGAGDDLITSGNGDDTSYGDGDNDSVSGGNGDDTIYGGIGNDWLSGDNGSDWVYGEDGDDWIMGSSGVDWLYGGDGNDVLEGGGDHDFLYGAEGNDAFFGGAGNDTFFGGHIANLVAPADYVDFDVVSYEDATAGVIVNLQTGEATGDGSVGHDTFTGIEGVTGSAYDDTLTGSTTTRFEFFRPGAGNDTIDGGALFNRVIYSEASGGIAVDLAAGTVTGGPSVGSDTLRHIEQVRGTDDADVFVATGFGPASVNSSGGAAVGSYFFNAFEGAGGDDTITGNGNTRVSYSFATAGIVADLAGGTVTGDSSVGHDTILGGVNRVQGSSFDDTLIGGNTLFNGFEGFEGRGGNDTIFGGTGFDFADYANDGNVTVGITVNMAGGIVTGDTAGEVLTGVDRLFSVEAVRGTVLDDIYDATGFGPSSANAGSNGTFNVFEGNAGNDTITGNGNTRLTYDSSAQEGIVVNVMSYNGVPGPGNPFGAIGSVTGGPSVGVDTFKGVTQIRGSFFDDIFNGTANPGNSAEEFIGWGGDDTIFGGAGFDRALYIDAIFGGVSVDMAAGTVIGDTSLGNDTLRRIETVRGTNFADTYVATGFSGASTNAGDNGTFNEFEGMGGNDIIIGNGDTRIAYTQAGGSVVVTFTAAGTGTTSGAAGVDSFTGVRTVRTGSFADTITGSDSNASLPEVFEGRAGNDTIDGRGGFDIARYDNEPAQTGIFVNVATGMVTGDASIGNDTLLNIEAVRGTSRADIYDTTGFVGSSEFEGMGGNDTVIGNGATGIAFGAAGGSVTADFFAGTVSGSSIGADQFSGVRSFRGSLFGDTVIGNGGTELVYTDGSAIVADLVGGTVTRGGTEVDMVSGIGAINGSPFADTMYGGGAGEYFFGSSGGDYLGGGGGNDYLRGMDGNDTLAGGSGNDTLEGNTESDTLNGGTGDDWLSGGLGADVFAYDSVAGGDGADTISDFEIGDVVDLGGGLVVDTGLGTTVVVLNDGTTLTANNGYNWQAADFV